MSRMTITKGLDLVGALFGVPDWCGEYAEAMRGDEPACAAYVPLQSEIDRIEVMR